MAVSEFEKIAAEAARRWELTRVAIVHRVGVVPLGEASVGIAVSAPHRRESIEACHYCIDALKLVAPIWKKEHFEGGEVWIGSLADCDHGDGDHGHAPGREGHARHGIRTTSEVSARRAVQATRASPSGRVGRRHAHLLAAAAVVHGRTRPAPSSAPPARTIDAGSMKGGGTSAATTGSTARAACRTPGASGRPR